MRFIFTIALILIVARPANALVFDSGNELFSALKNYGKVDLNYKDSMDSAVAMGFIIGIARVLQSAGTMKIPDRVTNGQFIDIVRNYLANNPANRHLSGHILVIYAIGEAFPLKNTVKP